MLVERIWSGNSLRNFHYLIVCPQTGEALAVDPLEWRMCLTAAVRHGWEITPAATPA
jgi:hydroxyacylglutathione hydrolase